jgi:L-fuculose-phosphate aldolase
MKKYDGMNKAMVERFAPQPGRRSLLPEMSDKAQVALMCRMLFKEGWNEHIAGHITCRQPDGTILTNPWELAWDELTASDIMTLDHEGKIIEHPRLVCTFSCMRYAPKPML